MLAVRDAIPKACDLASAELSTLRSRFIKIAARVIESAGRLRIAFAAGCSKADMFRGLPVALSPLGPETTGRGAPSPLCICPTRSQDYKSSSGEKPTTPCAPNQRLPKI